MSTLAIRENPRFSAADTMYHDRRSTEASYRPQPHIERIELPPLREVMPDMGLSETYKQSSLTTSPTNDNKRSPNHSPMSKRRRLSEEEVFTLEKENQARFSNGYMRNPPSPPAFRYEADGGHEREPHVNPFSRPFANAVVTRSPVRINTHFETLPSPSDSRASGFSGPSGPEPRRVSEPNTPFSSQHASSIQSQSPSTFEQAFRPTLPRLPALSLQPRDHRAPDYPDPRAPEYMLESSRAPAPSQAPTYSSLYAHPQHNSYPPPQHYGYQQPRAASVPGPYYPPHHDHHHHDRMPFSNGRPYNAYGGGYGMEHSDGGHDHQKQRKRRGNLPKQTTDILRSWFHGHLDHPYPTEDEKQELMRQTQLQMNQISNWFINARRRVLPTMLNNARAEAAARESRHADGDGAVQQPNGETSTDHQYSKSEGRSESDGEGSNCEDDSRRCNTW